MANSNPSTAHAGAQIPSPQLPFTVGTPPSQGYQNGGPFYMPHRVLKHIMCTIVLAPFRTSYTPVVHLLNASNAPVLQHNPQPSNMPGNETRDQLTSRWRESKLSELSFVGLTSALIASLFGSAFTWPIFTTSSWSTKACWYCGLLCIIASITIATQQSIVLHRLSSHEAAMSKIRRLLSHPYRNGQGRWRANMAQVFVWQLAVMMLRFGIVLFIFGLTIVLWDTAAVQAGHWSLSDLKP